MGRILRESDTLSNFYLTLCVSINLFSLSWSETEVKTKPIDGLRPPSFLGGPVSGETTPVSFRGFSAFGSETVQGRPLRGTSPDLCPLLASWSLED